MIPVLGLVVLLSWNTVDLIDVSRDKLCNDSCPGTDCPETPYNLLICLGTNYLGKSCPVLSWDELS